MSPLAFAKARTGAAKEIGVSKAVLDSLVKAKRRERESPEFSRSNGRPIKFPEAKPWGEAVSGADLLDRLSALLREYVIITDEVQLCAQALCLEEMTGRPVPEGALFYAETKRRLAVPATSRTVGRAGEARACDGPRRGLRLERQDLWQSLPDRPECP